MLKKAPPREETRPAEAPLQEAVDSHQRRRKERSCSPVLAKVSEPSPELEAYPVDSMEVRKGRSCSISLSLATVTEPSPTLEAHPTVLPQPRQRSKSRSLSPAVGTLAKVSEPERDTLEVHPAAGAAADELTPTKERESFRPGLATVTEPQRVEVHPAAGAAADELTPTKERESFRPVLATVTEPQRVEVHPAGAMDEERDASHEREARRLHRRSRDLCTVLPGVEEEQQPTGRESPCSARFAELEQAGQDAWAQSP